jgi:hypothetical protein
LDADRGRLLIEGSTGAFFGLKKLKVIFFVECFDDFLKFASSDYAHYAGFGIGVNGFMNANDRIALKEDAPFLELDFAKSLNFQFNVLEKRFAIYHE